MNVHLVNGHSLGKMNAHWAKHLEPCKCGSNELMLYRKGHNDTMLIQCRKCHLAGTEAPTYEDAIRNFKMVQLIS